MNIFDDFPFQLEKDEELKQIKECPDYWISNYGKIFSYKSNRKDKWYEMTLRYKHGKYAYIFLTQNNKSIEFSIHRLVAYYFCQGYEKNLVVNHIDANIKNNYYKNLEWVTQKENVNKSYITSGIGAKRNYKYITLFSPDNIKLGRFAGSTELNNYIKMNNLKCSCNSLIRHGYSQNYRIIKESKNEI